MNPERSETWNRGYTDCVQDSFENAPFASIGGLEGRVNFTAPIYISKDLASEYLQGYEAAALSLYGEDWRSCEFQWRPAITIDPSGVRGNNGIRIHSGKEDPMTTKFRPLHDNVLVKRNDAEKVTKSGLHIPQSSQPKSSFARVIAVGPGRFVEGSNEKRRPIGLEVGQTIFFPKGLGREVELDDEEGYVILREDEIEGIVEEP